MRSQTDFSPLTPASLCEQQLLTAERVILWGGTVLMLLGLVLQGVMADQRRVVLLAVALHAVLAPLLVLGRRRRNQQLRGGIVILYVYGISLAGLSQTGPLVGVGTALMAASVAAARFFGWRGVAASSFIALAMMSLTALAYLSGWAAVPTTVDAHFDSLSDWLRLAGTTATVSLLVGLVVAQIGTQLEFSFARTVKAIGDERAERAERLRTRELLEGAARDEAMGRLAGGVAHDVNNALSVIMTNAQLLSELHTERSENRDLADEMVLAARRAAETTSGLLRLGRSPREPELGADPGEVCEKLVKLLRRAFPESVEIRLERQGTRATSLGPTTIEQIVLAQALDARDVLATAGVLTLRVRDWDDARQGGTRIEIDCEVSPFAPHRRRISLRQHQALPSRASSAAAERSLRQGGGGIEVQRFSGGVRICIDLPPPPNASPSPGPAAELPHVLLVEDEDAVRRAMVRVLERAGYRVTQVSDGRSAERVFSDKGQRFDLLLTDAVMPETNTGEMIRRFLVAFPRAPVVVCSGYVKEEIVLQEIAHGAYLFVAKPFTPAELCERVQEALGVSERVLH